MKNKYLAILLLLALAAGSGGCSTQPSQPAQTAQDVQAPSAPAIQADSQAYSDEGLKKYQAGDYAGALNDFDKALSLDANNYQAMWVCQE